MRKSASGFTIVELLIAVVVIAILAAISTVAYSNVQNRARNASIQSDIAQIHKLVELYAAEHGAYPKTTDTTIAGNVTNARSTSDHRCYGHSSYDWVPGLGEDIPQGDRNRGGGVNNGGGCYMYQSDGVHYIISAWNMLKSPQTSVMYRRLGFREANTAPQFYWCNQINIGGRRSGTYELDQDYYKYSYTVSNIDWCNETPPEGA